jgi:hypothetical protein
MARALKAVQTVTLVATTGFVQASASVAGTEAVSRSSKEPVKETAEFHRAREAACLSRAKNQREIALVLQKSLEKEIAGIAVNLKAPENPRVTRARDYFGPLIEVATTAAAEAEREAGYHRDRARDLQDVSSMASDLTAVPGTRSSEGQSLVTVETASETAEFHLARLVVCLGKATEQRETAIALKKSLDKEIGRIAVNHKAPDNPYVRKAHQQFDPLIEAAQAGAAELEREAAYHRERAKELKEN